MEFKWKPEYSVKVKEIDNQHKKIIEIFNQMYQAVGANNQHDEVLRVLNELLEYAKYHFFTEEHYFKKFNYEFSKEHIADHHSFTKKISELKKRFNSQEVEVTFELIDYLEDWLVNHVLNEDHKYIQCFKKHGLK